jgi:hypothetical protein
MEDFEIAQMVIINSLKNDNTNAHIDISKYLTPDLNVYLQNKEDIHCFNNEINNIQVENLSISPTLIEKKILDDNIYYLFNVELSFNYTDTPEISSGMGTNIELVMDKNINKVISYYDQSDYFDTYMLGEKTSQLRDSDIVKGGYLKAKVNALHNNIEKIYRDENKISDTVISLEATISAKTKVALNITKISSYANTNCKKTNPASGNGSVSYYDFSQISGNYDCTNFVSHALLAGGAKVHDTGGSGISATGWYYRNTANRSSSWSGVINLHTYLTTNPGTNAGMHGTGVSYSTSGGGSFGIGDIVQFHNGSVWRHSTVVSGHSISGGVTHALVTGRTSPGVYNYYQNANTIYAGNSKRVIKDLRYYK